MYRLGIVLFSIAWTIMRSLLALVFVLYFLSWVNAVADNTVSSTVVTNGTPPTANSGTAVISNNDICATALGLGVQTGSFGISTGGILIEQDFCMILKQSKLFYSYGLKIPAVTIIALNSAKAFDSMIMSGVPPPFKNLIGQQALTEWEKPQNWYMIPEDSKILAKWKTELANKKIARAEKKRKKIKPKVRPDNVKKGWPFAFSIGALIFLL
tara:strand:+ start:448 stop:1083 length:636 start_codon:yes stop_codon:yes gene_type:complete